MQHLNLEERTVPHLKDPIHICMEPKDQDFCMTFNMCYVSSKYPYSISMMIILHGDTIEQLTFILSEFRAALAVANAGRGSRQPHMEQL